MSFNWNVPGVYADFNDRELLEKYVNAGSVDFYFDKENIAYSAERTLWRFVYRYGLCKEEVDLDAQEKKRKYCEGLIAGIGFDDSERLGVKRLEREPELPDILSECGFSAGQIFDG